MDSFFPYGKLRFLLREVIAFFRLSSDATGVQRNASFLYKKSYVVKLHNPFCCLATAGIVPANNILHHIRREINIFF